MRSSRTPFPRLSRDPLEQLLIEEACSLALDRHDAEAELHRRDAEHAAAERAQAEADRRAWAEERLAQEMERRQAEGLAE